MKSAQCEKCGAGVVAGASSCQYCGAVFVTAAPGVYRGSPVDDEVARLLRAGQKIQAIKVFHQRHRCGLREAKDAVDALERTMGLGG
ncbi:MAG: hypothetical protein R3A48_06145 [Polyangiales bacterium]